MSYFIEKKLSAYNAVIERLPKNSEYSFPFVRASIGMIKRLCEILQIGEKEPVDDCYKFIYLLITLYADGINEFFATCLILFAKIWSEMKAQFLDFGRALAALESSLHKIALESYNVTKVKNQINDFSSNIEKWKYDYLKKNNRIDRSNCEPIKDLKKILINEVEQMIKPKRMNSLVKGDKFDKVRDRKLTNKKQYLKLNSDLKLFTFGDIENNGQEVHIEVDLIKSVRKEDFKNKQYVLSITTEQVTFLFGSGNEELIEYWVEAIDMLIAKEPGYNIECFVNCLMETQLLDLNTLGYEIPSIIPQVPKEPNDFNFNFLKV